MREREIIIESNFKNALAWVKREEEWPWNVRFLYNNMKNILLILKGVIFEHKNREANDIADPLAKEGPKWKEGGLCGRDLVD